MKKFIVILALFMLFKPILPIVEYVVFYDYIKNELCVNKDKPELKCNGKCHLMKEMANASKNENSDKKHFSVESTVVFYQDICTDFSLFSAKEYVAKKLFLYHATYHFNFSSFIFHPPSF
ncbi:hypothetical protein NU10_05005 [Flavobacterium dauae]|uniref:hypothetical protein n=1 Tax=Flavobacteriaceae TaxID=49546 RepID=UPI00101B3627|nr:MULTISPECIES: hypothetical protein [Flavobacteriaceae]WLD24748.1 hypothetical protein NU10_05005 [Flavobacterium dauae]